MKKALPGKEDVEDSEVQIFIKSFGMQVRVLSYEMEHGANLLY